MPGSAWTERLAGLRPGRFDVHTHAIDPDLPDVGSVYGGSFPSIERTGTRTARMIVDGRAYREIDERCWSPSARLRDMDAEGVAVQVLSPIPVTLCHEQPADGAAELARVQNDFLAGMVAEAPHRFLALGAVPMQDPARAVAELTRCVHELGFLGVEIGTRVGDLELANPVFLPFFEAASQLSAVILVHPVDRALDARLGRLGFGFGLGMPFETSVAAAALLAARTLDAAPGARIVLAHGAGSFPAILPRLDRGQLLVDADMDASQLASARARRLWCDSLTYDVASLELAVGRFGTGHVVLGTDYPFAARECPAGAVFDGLDTELRSRLEGINAQALCADVGAKPPHLQQERFPA
ncbi:amidohydrolase family protein (plasmid) [Rhodococcus pseudokoreensis]|uniref:2-amino-3-carboxymuconate-6-semialdehyde decarboxylase n=1 Tax=Rhodococcus pseudokoreensis TaxID=2811421 RepID=A0A974VXE5_9NOCA|nr:amidohydrolase family protein [Rhodococcus pseudokoreensis]QSE87433.1 amidohydrolase family protein [Rhodococcus pseudokoreensis]